MVGAGGTLWLCAWNKALTVSVSMSLNICSFRETRGNYVFALWKNVVMLLKKT